MLIEKHKLALCRARRNFLKASLYVTGLTAIAGAASCVDHELSGVEVGADIDLPFKISLAQWSLNRAFWGTSARGEWRRGMDGEILRNKMRMDLGSFLKGRLDPIEFPRIAREQFDIGAVEYVNTFYFDKARDEKYLSQLRAKALDAGVENVLIMVDWEGNLGNPGEKQRLQAVEDHLKWVDAAAFLGCHAIRVNARSDKDLSWSEQQKLAADGLAHLAEYAAAQDIDVIVENHGGLSSNGKWLASVIKEVGHENVGTLPDFGNFNISSNEHYDRYKGVSELMPFAGGVSAKTYDFDQATGEETTLDYGRLMAIVLNADYHGYVGIEYEGDALSEEDGIRATKALLERIQQKAKNSYGTNL